MTNQLSRLEYNQSVIIGCYCVSRIKRGYLVQGISGTLRSGVWYHPMGVYSLDQVNQLLGGIR